MTPIERLELMEIIKCVLLLVGIIVFVWGIQTLRRSK